MKTPRIAVTMGDPAGVGPEVIIRSLLDGRVREMARYIVVGYPEPFARDAELLGVDFPLEVVDSPEQETTGDALPLLVPDRSLVVPLHYAETGAATGAAAGTSIETAIRLANDRAVDAIVTAPINKESFNMGGFAYPGHTEMLRSLSGAPDMAMMLTLGRFRIVHVTTHVAIRAVPSLVTKSRIVRVSLYMHDALKLLGIAGPSLAVSGLNPHAGEGGMFGDEERREIIPAVDELRERGLDVTGPLPPDTVFARAWCGEFDGVVAMFHDQGHIALKLAGFALGEGERDIGGVNVTLGLPFIRTSVDHGTAFDIAGEGRASEKSMTDAIECAVAMVNGIEREMDGVLTWR